VLCYINNGHISEIYFYRPSYLLQKSVNMFKHVSVTARKLIQQFASKHKPQTFSRVCLRLKRGVYRWKLKCFTAHVTCHTVTLKSLKLFLAQLSCFDVPPCTFQYFQAIIIRSSHKKYEYKQVWSLLQYRELGNTETYKKAHQNMKNN
jgi:hypothetical protein